MKLEIINHRMGVDFPLTLGPIDINLIRSIVFQASPGPDGDTVLTLSFKDSEKAEYYFSAGDEVIIKTT